MNESSGDLVAQPSLHQAFSSQTLAVIRVQGRASVRARTRRGSGPASSSTLSILRRSAGTSTTSARRSRACRRTRRCTQSGRCRARSNARHRRRDKRREGRVVISATSRLGDDLVGALDLVEGEPRIVRVTEPVESPIAARL
jgi:hypothetical protein